MKFGENGGAIGYLIGEENRGLATMFVMMNAARLGVGLQGVGVAERATQQAVAYAKERRQGKKVGANDAPGMSPIIEHADVRRMLLTMKAKTQAARMICYATAREFDIAHCSSDEVERKAALDKAALLTPLSKAFSTDIANEVASLGIQVHGGMGFIEETGAAQFLRDARILPIYEGTNGIQSADLAFRKILRGGGVDLKAFLKTFGDVLASLKEARGDDAEVIHKRLGDAYAAVEKASEHLFALAGEDADYVAAVSSVYLKALASTACGMMMARAALAAQEKLSGGEGDAAFLKNKILKARFFAEHFLPLAESQAETVLSGAKTIVSSRF
jgi:hypothetical protein